MVVVLCITITTLCNSSSPVEVTSLNPNISFNKTITVTNNTGGYICLDNSLQLDGTGSSQNVVRVTAHENVNIIVDGTGSSQNVVRVTAHENVNIIVDGTGSSQNVVRVTAHENVNIIVNDIEKHSSDSYPAIPVSEFGTDHYVISYDDGSQFSVTASANDTIVKIEFYSRVNPLMDFEVTYDNVTFFNPTSLNVSLQEGEVFQLHTKQDLTGAFVSSDKPTAVISGNRKVKINQEARADHTAQQMPPVDTWGRRFITVPSPVKNTTDFYRILASSANTTVDIGNERYALEDEGDWFQVELSPSVPVEIVSNEAILVVKIVTNGETVTEADPCMMLVIPVEQWHYEYSFKFPDLSPAGYLLIAVQTVFKTRLLLNSEPLDMSKWIEVNNTHISVGYLRLPNAYYTLKSLDTDILFTAYMHQSEWKYAFCSPLGLRLEKINPTWIHKTVTSEICVSDPASTSTTISTTDNTSTTTIPTTASTTKSTTTPVTTTQITSTIPTSTSATVDPASASASSTTANLKTMSEITETTAFTSTSNEITPITTDLTADSCPCRDEDLHTTFNISEQEMNLIIARLQAHLRIIPNQTSKAIRMKVSIPDYRPSATVLGLLGWLVVVVSLMIIILNDVSLALSQLHVRKRGPETTSTKPSQTS